MKNLKKILSALIVLLVVFFVFLFWYQQQYSMDVIVPYELNTPQMEQSLLIATQGSDFKNKVTQGVVDRYKQDSLYIKVIDISGLGEIDPTDFTAIVVIHTWENWKPPVAVKSFLERTAAQGDKIIVLTTSGEGTYKMEDVDAITGESIIEDAPLFVDEIISRLDPLLNQKTRDVNL